MNKEANNTRHPLRRSPNNTVVDTAPKTEDPRQYIFSKWIQKVLPGGQMKSATRNLPTAPKDGA